MKCFTVITRMNHKGEGRRTWQNTNYSSRWRTVNKCQVKQKRAQKSPKPGFSNIWNASMNPSATSNLYLYKRVRIKQRTVVLIRFKDFLHERGKKKPTNNNNRRAAANSTEPLAKLPYYTFCLIPPTKNALYTVQSSNPSNFTHFNFNFIVIIIWICLLVGWETVENKQINKCTKTLNANTSNT